jgi:hypothetical protein
LLQVFLHALPHMPAGTTNSGRQVLHKSRPLCPNQRRVNAYIRTANAEAKITRDLMKKWNEDSNLATNLEQLKQIAINEGPSLDSAVQHNRKSTELMNVVKASVPSPCVESVSIIYKMASEDVALEVEIKNLAIQADMSTVAGLKRFDGALVQVLARKHAIVTEKSTYEIQRRTGTPVRPTNYFPLLTVEGRPRFREEFKKFPGPSVATPFTGEGRTILPEDIVLSSFIPESANKNA